MATLQEVEQALVKADKAGNIEDARILAAEVRRMRAQPAQQPAPTQAQKPAGFGEKLNAARSDIPRQLGLAARYGVEGLSDVAGIFSNPVAATSNYLFGTEIPMQREAVSGLLTKAGLPNPQTPTERIVADASRMMAGGGGLMGVAGLAGKTVPALTALTSRPGLQAASAAGSGLAGGYTRETGGDEASQFLASLAGGVAAPTAVAGMQAAGRGIANTAGRLTGQQPVNLQVIVNNAIESSGYRTSDIPRRVINQIETDAAEAMRTGELSPDALRRLVDYRLTGATPARGNLTLNPVDITRQQNMAKIGANSANPKLQSLAMRQNTNVGALLGDLNQLGANTSDDAFTAGQRVMRGLNAKAGQAKTGINAAYENARAQTGIDADIDGASFVTNVDSLLREKLLHKSLPSEVRGWLNDIGSGKQRLTVGVAEQIKTAIGNLQRASNDGSKRMALGLVRKALDEAPLVTDGMGDDAIKAFTAARTLNRNWRSLVEKTPALQAIEDGVAPDKFVNDYVMAGSSKADVMDVARLKNAIKGSPDAIKAVRDQILAHLKSRATSGKPDEAMTFSQSGYNNALSRMGEQKLKMFFSPDEINMLKSVGRVAMYEQIQPSGSAVNNSNTAAMAIGKIFDWIANNPVTEKIPLGSQIVNQPTQAISTAIQGRNIGNIPGALQLPRMKQPAASWMPLPLLLTPGLEQRGD